MRARLTYLELPVADVAAATRFHAAAFGWDFAGFGATYAATTTGNTDIGPQGDRAEATTAALPVIEIDDIAAAQAAIGRAGGVVTRPIFGFPGGRRFHFQDRDGNKLAMMQPS